MVWTRGERAAAALRQWHGPGRDGDRGAAATGIDGALGAAATGVDGPPAPAMTEGEAGVREQPAAGDEPDPIPGLEPFGRRQRLLLLVVLALVLAGLLLVAFVPRTLASGTTLTGGTWQVRVTPGVVAPTFTLSVDDERERVPGSGWSGGLQASVVRLGAERTAVVGSAPWSADSVRLQVAGLGLRESQVRLVGWHRVHATVLTAPVEITEVVAIGGGGQVLEVLDDPDPPTLLGGSPG